MPKTCDVKDTPVSTRIVGNDGHDFGEGLRYDRCGAPAFAWVVYRIGKGWVSDPPMGRRPHIAPMCEAHLDRYLQHPMVTVESIDEPV